MQNTLAEDKFEITELVNKLFMYTDGRQWNLLQSEVFAKDVWLDMSSIGVDDPKMMTAADICAFWESGFIAVDAAHHQAGQYIITIDSNGTKADIYAYAVATHYRREATKGNTRTFVGSYDLVAAHTPYGWRLTSFKYNLKYMDGNLALV